MQVSIADRGPVAKQITVTVPKNIVDKEFTDYFTHIKDKVDVDGFRKGHAPISVLRVRFSDQAQSEVSSKLIYDGVNSLISDHGIKVVGNPVIVDHHRATAKKRHIGEFKLDGTFVCTVDTEVEPPISSIEIGDLEISEPLINIDLWISEKLESFQFTFADRTPVADRPIQTGDEVVVDYEQFIDGVPVEGGKVEFLTITLKDTDHELDMNLPGHNIKEEFEFTTIFPVEHLDQKVAGKSVIYKCFVHNATEVKPHPLNDDLAKRASYSSLDELKSDLAARAMRDHINPLRAKIFTEIMDQILSRNQFEIPTAWIDAEMSLTMQRLGMKEVPSDPQVIANLREVATRVVRQNFVLDKIYENDKNIHLSAHDTHHILESEGRNVNMGPEQLLSVLKANGQYEGFISFYEHNRTIDFLFNSAKVRKI